MSEMLLISCISDDCQSSKNFEALKGAVCKAPCFRENQGFSGLQKSKKDFFGLDVQEHNSIL